MKRLLLISTVFFTLTVTQGQTLQQGVFTTTSLASDIKSGYPVSSCWGSEIDFFSNCKSYATGMNLYLRIDSVVGSTDSIKIWRSPDFIYSFVKATDTIPLNTNLSPIDIYYLANDTLYVSLIAIGTPLIAGESYYCNYSKVFSISVDCSNPITETWFAGGNGAMDTVKNCVVLQAQGINENKNNIYTSIYPNPFCSQTTLHSDKSFKNATLTLYNSFGQQVKQINNISGNEFILQRDNLPSGLYFIRLTPPSPKGEGWGEVIATEKLIITDN